jgi:hypothetical protein
VTIGRDAVLDRAPLLGIERLKIGCSRCREHESSPSPHSTLVDSLENRNVVCARRKMAHASRWMPSRHQLVLLVDATHDDLECVVR